MMANLAQDGGERRALLRESEEGLRRCLDTDPTDPRAYVSLGKILLQQKRYDEARKLYADGTSNTGAAAARWGGGATVTRMRAPAAACRKQHMVPPRRMRQLAHARSAPWQRRPPGNTNPYIWAAWGYLEYRSGNVSRARKLFDAAIVVDETHAAAWHKWGMLEMRQGNFLRARCAGGTGAPCFQSLLRLHAGPQSQQRACGSMRHRAAAHADARRAAKLTTPRDLWTRGIQKCRKAPQKSNTYLYCSLAVMAAELGKLGEARSWFEEGTRTNLGKASCALWHAWAMVEARIGDPSAVRCVSMVSQ